ncbi:alpha/beta hydrolase [Kineosporia rhizophila]|uniref:alpha/beta hydrolase n=1 Tax=Kineosporia rhizophila TaxID=84633 RepID=UPI001E3576ED|nr:alpha/beta hydrolase [Kineosporia rhizophila]MCE0538771.1 alpha/beta hydrolase [Kineosporia rhizophila]
MLKARATATVAAALLLCGACTSSAQETGPAKTQPLTWGECPPDSRGDGLECTTLDVPLDYRDPDGRTIEIAVSRLKSADPGKRRGILLTNAGGPGGASLSYPAILKQLGMPERVLETYDVIGMDPRGVGHSTPVTCGLKAEEWISNVPRYAADPAEVTEAAQAAEAIAAKCGDSGTAGLLPHITTANTARDLDLIRQSLGEEKASYFGISYGTYLGSVYTSLFPETTDRVMLDSATGPGGWDSEFSRLYGQGFQDRFPDFAEFVAEQPKYGLGRTPGQVQEKYFELAGELDRRPSAEGFNGDLFRQLTFANLYYDWKFEELAKMWQALDQGTPVPQPSTGPTSTPAPAGDVPADNYLASQLHVICNDSDWPEDVQSYQRNVEADRKQFPMFGAAGANITPCAFWPGDPLEPPVQIGAEGPANVLILQNLRDPATPAAGARQLREAFGDRARLVTADQGGHLNYLYLGNSCAEEITTTFLVSGERPAQDQSCAAGPKGKGGPRASR